MNLFDALRYTKLEDRSTALLLAVLERVAPETIAALLPELEVEAERPHVSTQVNTMQGVLDGTLTWGCNLAVVLETKVDAGFQPDQLGRYERWLLAQPQDQRVLWVLTRDGSAPTEVRPSGVSVVRTSWRQFADRADDRLPASDDTDRLLLTGLLHELRQTGVAPPARPSLDPQALASALAHFDQIRRLRETLAAWLERAPIVDYGPWRFDVRHGSWRDLSVCAHRWMEIPPMSPGEDPARLCWWIEAFAPTAVHPHWPTEQPHGVALRVGWIVRGRSDTHRLLAPLQAALGEPIAKHRDDFRPAPDRTVWRYDSGVYHEVWWAVPLDPFDLAKASADLQTALNDQWDRVRRLLEE